jgi:type II secretory pathway component PulF
MFLSPRIRLKPLAQLCRRLAIATGAGLEDRRIWRDEAQRGGRAQREAVGQIGEALAKGESIDDALAAGGNYFPPLFQQMVAVGDESGNLDRTYRRLAEHYEHLLAARRTLLGALAWPGIQLALALLTIGVVIAVSSWLNVKDLDGQPLDLFGLGLTGRKGITIYVMLIILAAIAALLTIEAMRRGMLWTRGLQNLALKIPGIGTALETLAMARFTWALQLVFDTSMDLRKALPLALDATGHHAYRSLGPRVARNIGQGMTLYSALAETGAFPVDLLEAISVGEQSGKIAETMQRQSKDYQERAAAAIGMLARILGGIIWVAVAMLIIVLIFRVFNNYVGMINTLSQPGGGGF